MTVEVGRQSAAQNWEATRNKTSNKGRAADDRYYDVAAQIKSVEIGWEHRGRCWRRSLLFVLTSGKLAKHNVNSHRLNSTETWGSATCASCASSALWHAQSLILEINTPGPPPHSRGVFPLIVV